MITKKKSLFTRVNIRNHVTNILEEQSKTMPFYLTDEEVGEILFYSGASKGKRHQALDSLGSSYATRLRQNAHTTLVQWSDYGVPNTLWPEIEKNSPNLLKKFNLVMELISDQQGDQLMNQNEFQVGTSLFLFTFFSFLTFEFIASYSDG